MISWNPVIQPKFIQQPLLQPGLLSHHPPGPPTVLMANYRIPGQTDRLDEFFKGGLYPEDVLACAAALRLRRPVKWIEDR